MMRVSFALVANGEPLEPKFVQLNYDQLIAVTHEPVGTAAAWLAGQLDYTKRKIAGTDIPTCQITGIRIDGREYGRKDLNNFFGSGRGNQPGDTGPFPLLTDQSIEDLGRACRQFFSWQIRSAPNHFPKHAHQDPHLIHQYV